MMVDRWSRKDEKTLERYSDDGNILVALVIGSDHVLPDGSSPWIGSVVLNGVNAAEHHGTERAARAWCDYMIVAAKVPGATYYDCGIDDEVRLKHTTFVDAVVDHVEASHSSAGDFGEVRVRCFSRLGVDGEMREQWANNAVETLVEWWHESELSDPDGYDENVTPDVEKKTRELVDTFLNAQEVWACRVSRLVTLTPSDVNDVMRHARPGWFA